MADYTKEQFEELPDFAKEDLIEVDGMYKNAGFVKVKNTANDLDSQLKAQVNKSALLSDRLAAFEQKEADSAKAKTEKN